MAACACNRRSALLCPWPPCAPCPMPTPPKTAQPPLDKQFTTCAHLCLPQVVIEGQHKQPGSRTVVGQQHQASNLQGRPPWQPASACMPKLLLEQFGGVEQGGGAIGGSHPCAHALQPWGGLANMQRHVWVKGGLSAVQCGAGASTGGHA